MTQEAKIVGGTPSPSTFGLPGNEAMVDPTFSALRVKLQPAEYLNQGLIGGHYTAGQVSGALTGVGAAGAVFSARWAPSAGAVPYMVLKRLQIGYTLTTAFTAGQTLDFDVVRCTGFTAADSGGTALVLTGNNNKNRSGLMAASSVADMRIASTAALTAGTKTQDANPFGYVTSAPINVTPSATVPGGNMQLTDLYSLINFGQHPEVFANNEGFNVRAVTAMGSTGVIKLYVVASWAEVPGI